MSKNFTSKSCIKIIEEYTIEVERKLDKKEAAEIIKKEFIFTLINYEIMSIELERKNATVNMLTVLEYGKDKVSENRSLK